MSIFNNEKTLATGKTGGLGSHLQNSIISLHFMHSLNSDKFLAIPPHPTLSRKGRENEWLCRLHLNILMESVPNFSSFPSSVS